MGIKKNDFFSFIIASALNIGLIYLIPTFTTEDVGDKKIKVGLVALEKEKTFSKENNKDLPNKKKSEKKQTQNTTVENIVENTEEVKKEKSLNLVELSKGIQAPSFEIISSKKDKSIKRKSKLEFTLSDNMT